MPSYKTCFECGMASERSVAICPKCGSELPDVSKQALPADPPAPATPPPARRGRPPKKVEASPVAPAPEPQTTRCLGYQLDPRYSLVSTPAGKPPATPAKDGEGYSTKQEDVQAWVEEIITKGWDRKVRYSAGALEYWGRNYFWPAYPNGWVGPGIHPDCLEVKRIIYACFEEPCAPLG